MRATAPPADWKFYEEATVMCDGCYATRVGCWMNKTGTRMLCPRCFAKARPVRKTK